MIAVEFDRYGPAAELAVRDVAEPGALAPDRIRVAVAYASLNPKDTFVRKGRFRALMGPDFPKRTGYDWSGHVEAVGAGVSGFSPGDGAYGMINGWEGGTCAARIDVRASESARVPAGIALEVAAAVPLAGQTSLQALCDVARLKAGDRIAINGASGGVGLFAIGIAKALGAHVTAVASAENRTLCSSMGADAFVAYGDDSEFANAGDLDVLFDVFGNLTFDRFAARFRPGGAFVSTVPSPATFAAVAATPANDATRARLVAVNSRSADLERLGAMLASGALAVSIDHVFPVTEIVAAHERIETKHTRGKVVVSFNG